MMPPVPPDVAAQRFISLLDAACSRIGEPWFRVSVNRTSGSVSTAYRERVYCYELYHQLRMLGDSPEGRPAGAPDYVPFGEIDKSGLDAVTDGGEKKPDLVWHIPGTSHNAAVLEVKCANRLTHREVAKDLKTLATFLSAAGNSYRLGALLVFGPVDRDDLRERVRQATFAASVDAAQLRNSRLLRHRAVGANLEDLGGIT